MIEEVYVSLEVAKLLREKAFNETCRAYWGGFIDKPLYLCECNRGKYFDYCRNSQLKKEVCDDEQDYIAAPTQQMVMKWLREVHSLHINIFVTWRDKIPHYQWSVDNLITQNTICDTPCLEKYEEACKAAIKYCLENLI